MKNMFSLKCMEYHLVNGGSGTVSFVLSVYGIDSLSIPIEIACVYWLFLESDSFGAEVASNEIFYGERMESA